VEHYLRLCNRKIGRLLLNDLPFRFFFSFSIQREECFIFKVALSPHVPAHSDGRRTDENYRLRRSAAVCSGSTGHDNCNSTEIHIHVYTAINVNSKRLVQDVVVYGDARVVLIDKPLIIQRRRYARIMNVVYRGVPCASYTVRFSNVR